MVLDIMDRLHAVAMNLLIVIVIPIIVIVFITRKMVLDFKNKLFQLNKD